MAAKRDVHSEWASFSTDEFGNLAKVPQNGDISRAGLSHFQYEGQVLNNSDNMDIMKMIEGKECNTTSSFYDPVSCQSHRMNTTEFGQGGMDSMSLHIENMFHESEMEKFMERNLEFYHYSEQAPNERFRVISCLSDSMDHFGESYQEDALSGPDRNRPRCRDRRQAANQRERKRMISINGSFEVLRTKLPQAGTDESKRLSKVETLKQAIDYIRLLEGMLQEIDNTHSKIPSNCPISITYPPNENEDGPSTFRLFWEDTRKYPPACKLKCGGLILSQKSVSELSSQKQHPHPELTTIVAPVWIPEVCKLQPEITNFGIS